MLCTWAVDAGADGWTMFAAELSAAASAVQRWPTWHNQKTSGQCKCRAGMKHPLQAAPVAVVPREFDWVISTGIGHFGPSPAELGNKVGSVTACSQSKWSSFSR